MAQGQDHKTKQIERKNIETSNRKMVESNEQEKEQSKEKRARGEKKLLFQVFCSIKGKKEGAKIETLRERSATFYCRFLVAEFLHVTGQLPSHILFFWGHFHSILRDGRTDGRTDGQTDKWTNGRTDQ